MTSGRHGNLPPELTTFVGRRREVTEVRRRLTGSRLVTLVGTGGVGKTRLALRVADTMRRTVRDGVWLVELDQLHDPALVAQTVARTLGLMGQAGQPPVETLIGYLADRQLLLVLDNCEHLVDAVAKLIDALLRTSADLQVLATSREPLGIDGEVLVPVAPLAVPDPEQVNDLPALSGYEAVALFVDRAAMVTPGFTISADNRAAVAEICHHLDGVPLAIELTVPWLRTLTPAQLSARLPDRLRHVLASGRRGGPERHQTLRSCIAWSYELCTHAERQLWARLSVFAGAFDLEAARAVCAGPDADPTEVFELTAALLDKSVLIPERHEHMMRYRILNSLRAYGAERLSETGHEATIRRRHRDRYAWFIRGNQADWLGTLTPDWFIRLDREYPDVRAALEYSLTEPGEARTALAIAGALHPYWTMRGLASEGRYWLDRALARDTSASAEAVVAAYLNALLAALQRDFPAANALVGQSHAIATELGDPWSRAIALHAEGTVALYGGDLEHARLCDEAALAAYQTLGDSNWSTLALVGVATANTFLGEYAQAADRYEQVLAATEPRNEAWVRTHALWAFGIALWKQGDVDRAAERIEQCLRLAHRIRSPLRASWCVEALAWIAASRGQPRRAATLLGSAQALSHSIGAPAAIMFPDLLVYHEECERRTRSDLGETKFAAAVTQGATMLLEEAISNALGHQPGEAPSSVRAGADHTGTAELMTLTSREQEICELVAEGLSNQQIATRLVISRRTAESHVQNSMGKLGFTKRTQIAAWVAEQRHGHDSPPR